MWKELGSVQRRVHIPVQIFRSNPTSLSWTGGSTFIGTVNNVTQNNLSHIDEYLNNLAHAATHTTTMMAQLIESNRLLAMQVAMLTARLTTAPTDINIFVPTGSPTSSLTSVPPGTPMSPRNLLCECLKHNNPIGYCWSHGYMVGKTHTSTYRL